MSVIPFEINLIDSFTETLRKYPPIPFIMRLCTKTYPVPESDLVIEKGTKLFVPLLGLQRDPEFYPNPEVFDPERFSPEGKAARHPYTWLPFGEGPRACIGKYYLNFLYNKSNKNYLFIIFF